jgi:hypothetical protein
MNKLEALINAEDAGANHRKFNAIKETILQRAKSRNRRPKTSTRI